MTDEHKKIEDILSGRYRPEIPSYVSNRADELNDYLERKLAKLAMAAIKIRDGEDEENDVASLMFQLADLDRHLGQMFYEMKVSIAETATAIEGMGKVAESKLAEANAEIARLSTVVSNLERFEQDRLREHNPQSPEVRAKVYAMTDGKCAYCGCEISPGRDDGKPEFVIEHVVPKSAGGPDHLTNYVPSCSCCNAKKSTGHVIEFIRRRAGG